MNQSERRIYAIEDIPPEIRAVTFAKCSRSSLPFDEIAKELTEEKSAEFNEKWVVGFGHSSIAEHAFLNIAIENVSLLAVECLQGNRLGSFTEKSSRYQLYDKERVYYPSEFETDSEIKELYQKTINKLFETYNQAIEPVKKIIAQLYPMKEGEEEKNYQGRIKSKWVDVCRFLLPSASLANLGMSCNARTWEYAISKALSHPLKEVRGIGQELKQVAQTITPTLVKYAEAKQYYIEINAYLADKTKEIVGFKNYNPTDLAEDIKVDLIEYDKDAENKILASLLYKYQTISYRQALAKIEKLAKEEKENIFNDIFKNAKSIYDKPPRELEYIYYTFDCLMDQGAYYDLKRNRIMTQTPQILSANYGYFTPKIIIEAGLENEYGQAQGMATEAYQKIYQKFPHEASYITTKAHGRRMLMKMNLREFFYFIGLRTKSTGHFMYRKVAQKMYDEVAKIHPMLAKYIIVDSSPTFLNAK